MQEKILEYIKTQLFEEELDIGADEDLLNSGLIDSLGVMRLISFIEKEFGTKVQPQEMTIENFINVEAISNLIVRIK